MAPLPMMPIFICRPSRIASRGGYAPGRPATTRDRSRFCLGQGPARVMRPDCRAEFDVFSMGLNEKGSSMPRALKTDRQWFGLGCGALLGLALSLADCSGSRPSPGPHFKIGAPYRVDGQW